MKNVVSVTMTFVCHKSGGDRRDAIPVAAEYHLIIFIGRMIPHI